MDQREPAPLQIDILPGVRSLPHSEEAERAVLGGLLLDPERLSDVMGWLDASDFYLERHRTIYEAMLAVAADGRTVDGLNLLAQLDAVGQTAAVGGVAYLSALDLDLPDVGRIQEYCRIIKERALRRRLIEQAGETIRTALDGGTSAEDIAGGLLTQLDGIIQQQTGEGYRPIAELLPEYAEHVEEEHIVAGVKTGIAHFDHQLGAFERGRMALIGGRAGVGKSAMMVQLLAQDLLAGEKSGVVSLEMREKPLLNRLFAHLTGIPATRLWRGQLSTQQWALLVQAQRFLHQHGGLFIDSKPNQRVGEIKAKARRLVQKHGVRAVYVDYGGLIERPGEKREHQEIEALSYDLARLANELGIVLVVFAQCNRGPARENRPPLVVDLREAGEQAAWYVVLLHRKLQQAPGDAGDDDGGEGKPVIYGPEGLVILGKNRDGGEGATRTMYDGPRLQWWERSLYEASAGQRGSMVPGASQQPLF